MVGGRSGLLLATVIGEGGDAGFDFAIIGTRVGIFGMPLGTGNGVRDAEEGTGGLTAELGAGEAELGLAGGKPDADPEALGLGGVLPDDGRDEGAELGRGGSPPLLGG